MLETTVLVIEDQAAIRHALSQFLGMKNCKVHAFESAEEALPLLEESQFDIALLDIVLPGMYGMNLMINAQQAFDGKPGTVTLAANADGNGNQLVTVRDDGPGIPKENVDQIFEPFFTTKGAGKGTGLGLSVSYGIIQDHEGRIHVDSEVGQGTTFRLTFPVLEEDTEPQKLSA